MIIKEFCGKTKEEALEKAMDVLKINKEQIFKVEYKEDSSILPFTKKKVTALVSIEEEDLFGNRSLIFVRDLLEKMNIEAKIYLIQENDEKVVIEIESPDTAMIIGKKGQTLEAIQTLVNVVLNKNSKIWTKIIIDIENYRKRRERNLYYIANKTANLVKKSKKSILLEPMNPFERRIIHLALQEERNVETESIGEGILKKVKVFYVENKNMEKSKIV